MCAWGRAEGKRKSQGAERTGTGRLALDLTLLPRALIAKVLQMLLRHPDHSGDLTLESPSLLQNALCGTPPALG